MVIGLSQVCKPIKAAGEKNSLVELMSHLLGLLSDDSAIAVRLALTALKLCLSDVFNSRHSAEALKALLALFKIKDNSYWLVKVCHQRVSILLYKMLFYYNFDENQFFHILIQICSLVQTLVYLLREDWHEARYWELKLGHLEEPAESLLKNGVLLT